MSAREDENSSDLSYAAELPSPSDQLRAELAVAEGQMADIENVLLSNREARTWNGIFSFILLAFSLSALMLVAIKDVPQEIKDFVPSFLVLSGFGLYELYLGYQELTTQVGQLRKLSMRLLHALHEARQALRDDDSEREAAGTYA